MAKPIELAQRFLDGSWGLRDALGIANDAALEPETVMQGEHNVNFPFRDPASGRRFLLRINYSSQMGLREQSTYEYRALQALAGSGRTPEPLFLDDSRQIIDKGVLVEEFVEGDWLDFARPEEVREAARALADVHATPVREGEPFQRPRDPLAAQFATCQRFLDAYENSPYADPSVLRYTRLFARLTGESLQTPCFSHDCVYPQNTEAVPSHFLIPHEMGPHGPEMAGPARMVDWEKPIIGEVAQDIAYFLSPTTTIWDTDYIFPAREREQFVEDYWEAVGGRFPRGSFDTRFAAYVRSNCLLGISWSCNAWVEYHDPARPLRNADTFELLKTYLSEEFLETCRTICFG